VLGPLPPASGDAELRKRLKRLESKAERFKWQVMESRTGKAELEEALLAIDPLPRRAMLLTIFEELSVEDTSILLNADRECVKTATAIGLLEMSQNLVAKRAIRCAPGRSPANVGAVTAITA